MITLEIMTRELCHKLYRDFQNDSDINDTVKGKGYGTRAEALAVEYAFARLGLATVYADTIQKKHTQPARLGKGRLSVYARGQVVPIL